LSAADKLVDALHLGAFGLIRQHL